VESAGGERACFSFSNAFKTYIKQWEGQTQELSIQLSVSGEEHGSSQPGAGGLGLPWATYMSPKLSLLLACLISIVLKFIGEQENSEEIPYKAP
jgi:hypothetical protein